MPMSVAYACFYKKVQCSRQLSNALNLFMKTKSQEQQEQLDNWSFNTDAPVFVLFYQATTQLTICMSFVNLKTCQLWIILLNNLDFVGERLKCLDQ